MFVCCKFVIFNQFIDAAYPALLVRGEDGNKVYLTVFMVFLSTKVLWCKFVDCESA